MKVDVWFMPDNQVSVEADNGLYLAGTVEEVKAELVKRAEELETMQEAVKTALARILYTPMGWD